jgi:hypothetical protein
VLPDQTSGRISVYWSIFLHRPLVATAGELGKKSAESSYLIMAGAVENGIHHFSVSHRSFS